MSYYQLLWFFIVACADIAVQIWDRQNRSRASIGIKQVEDVGYQFPGRSALRPWSRWSWWGLGPRRIALVPSGPGPAASDLGRWSSAPSEGSRSSEQPPSSASHLAPSRVANNWKAVKLNYSPSRKCTCFIKYSNISFFKSPTKFYKY